MTYDVTSPANTGSGILTENAKTRDNWVELTTTIAVDHNTMDATREGEHKQVTLFELSADPNAGVGIANTGFVYTKDDGSGATELFFMDAETSANVTQLTTGGQIYLPNTIATGVAVAWATSDDSGSGLDTFNLTVSGGINAVTFTFSGDIASDMSTTDYCVVVTPYHPTSAATRTFQLHTLTGASFKVNKGTDSYLSVVVYGVAN